MINMFEVNETNQMIEQENLDVRTITLGISLLDCIDSSLDKVNRKIYDKITTQARHLVETGREIEAEFGIPIVNKRISVTPAALVGGAACRTPEDFVTVAETLDRAALRAVQTPQIFESALLKAALQAAVEGGIPITDDCSAVERLGKRVYLVEGDEENLKITTPVDLILAEAILQAREDRI